MYKYNACELKMFITASGALIFVQNINNTFILYREINESGDVLKLLSGNVYMTFSISYFNQVIESV